MSPGGKKSRARSPQELYDEIKGINLRLPSDAIHTSNVSHCNPRTLDQDKTKTKGRNYQG